ncbi:superoxide dismutase [Candidatus Falkowbacteria bacterium]|nr:superoxide dismutase [Candidatus Falkowbacteria bacterium]
MEYQAKSFEGLLGLEGLTDQLLSNHFTLYQGYVTNTNKVLGEISRLISEDKAATPEFAELKRRLGWEWNGMRLHELYFEGLSKTPKEFDPASVVGQKIAAEFGSYDSFLSQLKATASMRGIGWVVLYFDRAADKLVISWINEHDAGHLAGAEPLMVLDVFEHAYMIDYGLKRADYLNTLVKAIDWTVIDSRLK